MKAAALVSVDEYLRTMYRPDRDYVDGEVIERNLGEREHSDLQTELAHIFRNHRRDWKTFAYVEQRVQVSKTRFRVPDVCVCVGEKPTEPIFRTPPFICIEVLSPDDTLAGVQDRIDDYMKFGVPYVWVINPRNRRAWSYTSTGSNEAKDGILKTKDPAFTLNLPEIFATLDE